MFEKLIASLISKSVNTGDQIEMIKRIGEAIADWDVMQDEYMRDFTEFIRETIKNILDNINNIK